MRLGEWVRRYRNAHGYSMQAMADLCGFSKAYIGMIEKGINPTTKKPLSPTMQTFQQIAKATGVDLDALIKSLDTDQPITINTDDISHSSFALSSADREHIEKYRSLTPGHKDAVDGLLNTLYEQDRDAAAPATERAGVTAGEEDERAKLHRLLDEELDKEKEERRASSYGNSVTGTK